MMAFTIRLLTETDAAILKPFRLQSLRDQPDAYHSTAEEWDIPLERFEALIRDNPVFAAFRADGNMCGLAILGVTGRTKKQIRHKCEIWSVYTDPSMRGQGIARHLMQACIAEARRRGYEAIILTAATHLAHVVTLYESLGFVIYGTERGEVKMADGRYVDNHHMELRLDQPSRPS
jgi:ribosomal protein S18 acetylase RimI-like enzyme